MDTRTFSCSNRLSKLKDKIKQIQKHLQEDSCPKSILTESFPKADPCCLPTCSSTAKLMSTLTKGIRKQVWELTLNIGDGLKLSKETIR